MGKDKKAKAESNDGTYNYKMFNIFSRKFKITEPEAPKDVSEIFSKFALSGSHLTPDQLRQFLASQGEDCATVEDAEKIIEEVINRRHNVARVTRNGLTLDDFFHYLFFDDLNGPIISQVHHDMTAPLSQYFIYTGHNSYLTGNQLSSDCSEVPIIRALKRGVRVIELDLWPGSSKDEVLVLHGRTLTTPVSLIKCLTSIRDHAFVSSPYPVIITLEDHLNHELQAKVAEMVIQTFGDMLYYPDSEHNLVHFPSPESLKHRIIISTKPPKEYLESSGIKNKEAALTTTSGMNLSEDEEDDDVVNMLRQASDPEVSMENIQDQTTDPEVGTEIIQEQTTDPGLEVSSEIIQGEKPDLEESVEITQGQNPDPEESTEIIQGQKPDAEVSTEIIQGQNPDPEESTEIIQGQKPDAENDNNQDDADGNDSDNKPRQRGSLGYKRLITIHAGKPKGDVKDALIATAERVGRLSLSEQELERAAAYNGSDVVRFTQKNILRVYPKGTRITSSNYKPHIGWMHGAQMIAFNMQGYGKSLWLMHGMFRANGGCGYVKKPDFLMQRSPENEVFDPKRALPVQKTLKVKAYLGDGWRLDFSPTHFDSYSPPDFYVKLYIVGVPADSAKRKTKIIEDNWTPSWDEEFTFPLSIPELALLRIEVREHDMSEKDDFGGQTCLPVSELRPGIRSVPLHDKKGEKLNNSRLLMRFEFV